MVTGVQKCALPICGNFTVGRNRECIMEILALFDPFEDCALNVLELPEKQVVAGSHHGVTTCDVVDPVTGAVLAVVPLQPSWWPRAVAGALALGGACRPRRRGGAARAAFGGR